MALLAAVLTVAACAAPPGPTPGPGTTPTPGPGTTPTPAPEPLSAADLKYALLHAFGTLWFCDPDLYPVGIDDIPGRAAERFPEIEADRETFVAILARLGIPEGPAYRPDQVLAIYTEWKVLNAILLDPIGNDRFRFDITTAPEDAVEGTRIAGTVDAAGAITVEQQAPSGPLSCPICLAAGTLIATPDGPRTVEDLRVGDVVWTVGPDGARVAAPLLRVGSMTAPASHRVVRLVLDDGRELLLSPGHPLSDAAGGAGRSAGELRAGDAYDRAIVVGVDLVPYGSGTTFDVLPAGPTGAYWANGVVVGSSLAPAD